MDRVILHSDMNNCYASIEACLNPDLRGKALIVCGSVENRNGIVLAKSQKAKKAGIKTGDQVRKAKEKCPGLILVPPHYEEYLKFSRKAREIYYSYTNQVEPFGLDECRLDVTGSGKLFGSGKEIADQIRERMKKELGLSVSVGVSFNKVFAKLGSDMKKPDATSLIPKEKFKEIVRPLEVDKMIGIGRATKKKLNELSIFTLGDLAKAPSDLLRQKLGINGVCLKEYAAGRDFREVTDFYQTSPIKSLGNSVTCKQDLLNTEEVFNVFQELALNVARRLKENQLEALGLEVYVRNKNLESFSFQTTIDLPCQSSIILARRGLALFKEKYRSNLPVRALGIRAIRLRPKGGSAQLDIFNNYRKEEKLERLDDCIYKIRKKHGKNAISFASLTNYIKLPDNRSEIVTLPNQLVR